MVDDAERMLIPPDSTHARRRTLYRLKTDMLCGWSVLRDDIGREEDHKQTVRDVCTMIRDDGGNPADYEFRIDFAPGVPWERGKVFDFENAKTQDSGKLSLG